MSRCRPLFVHDFWPGNAGLLSKAAHNVGMDDVVVGWYSGGMGAVEIDQYAQAAGAAAEGDIASMLFRRFEDMPGWADFMADYQAAGFDHMPDYPDVFGAYAYDAAGILFAAIQQAGSVDPEAVRLAIAATQDYPGVVCQYEGFDDHGDAIPQLAWMMNYRAGAWADMHPTRVYLPVTVK